MQYEPALPWDEDYSEHTGMLRAKLLGKKLLGYSENYEGPEPTVQILLEDSIIALRPRGGKWNTLESVRSYGQWAGMPIVRVFESKVHAGHDVAIESATTEFNVEVDDDGSGFVITYVCGEGGSGYLEVLK
jgi:hypothetical protein